MRPHVLAFVLLLAGPAAPADAQAPAATAPAAAPADPESITGHTSFLVENMTRVEAWRYFHPFNGGGIEPDYSFVGNRTSLGASYAGPRWSLQGTLQYVRLENLPTRAIGPGLMGTGAAYFFQAAGTFSYQFYLRGLSATWRARDLGTWVELGRLSRAASTEPPSGDATIDGLVREELNGRLLGDMEWSFYQRAWDGARGGVRRGGWSATATAALPTQGTYEESANLFMDRVQVGALEVGAAPGALVPRTRVDAFTIVYDDTRRITARPDNLALTTTSRAHIHVVTAGASMVGAYPSRTGTSDVVAWAAAQRGDWYGLRHRGLAATAAVGHRLSRVPWRPRLRAGVAWASGDGDATDGRHGTFFPLLPSGDRVSRLNAYALMNVVDAWTAIDATPVRTLDVRIGARRVRLADGADRWYQGSGATIRAGNYFGYQGRNARGATSLGTVTEGNVRWQPTRWWTLQAFAGRMNGGDVVSRLFSGHRLVTAWLESTVRF